MNDITKTVLDNIATRVSVRNYEDKAVEAEKVELLLRAGMAAPSAVDKRPWHFIVVEDKETLKEIARLTPNAHMAAHAPLAIVVCGDTSKALTGWEQDFWIQDTSAATQNILLAAHAMGLGAVWTGTWPGKDRVAAIAKLLKTPDHIIPFSTIVIGYPSRTEPPKNKWDEGDVTFFTTYE